MDLGARAKQLVTIITTLFLSACSETQGSIESDAFLDRCREMDRAAVTNAWPNDLAGALTVMEDREEFAGVPCGVDCATLLEAGLVPALSSRVGPISSDSASDRRSITRAVGVEGYWRFEVVDDPSCTSPNRGVVRSSARDQGICVEAIQISHADHLAAPVQITLYENNEISDGAIYKRSGLVVAVRGQRVFVRESMRQSLHRPLAGIPQTVRRCPSLPSEGWIALLVNQFSQRP
jgi:hypothetical protein